MADITYNQWGTVTFQIPDKLEEIRDKINTTAELLISVLDIALTALEFVKTFLVGYLDPIAALVNAIVQEVEALVTDMRQLGIYITGDWKMMNWPYHELQGGFQEYQRRMISRLTDMTDPTRPDVSASTKVLGMFFYLSVDVSDIERLIKFLEQITAFFKQSVTPEGSLPIPVLGVVQYGANAVDILHPKSIPDAFALSPTPPSLAKISWTVSSTSARSPFNPIPPLPPGGFLVSVSTVQEGLKVMFDAPQSNTSLQPSTTDSTKTVQPRDYGQVRLQDSGSPLILFGGSDMIQPKKLDDSKFAYNKSMDSTGKVSNGFSRVYAQLVNGSDGIIPIDGLVSGTDASPQKLMQRVFYVPQAEKWASWATGEYGFVLDTADMPYTCEWEKQPNGTIIPKEGSIEKATTAYVRIATVSKDAYQKQIQYIFGPPNARGGRPYIDAKFDDLTSQDLGAWSAPVRVTFPGSNTQTYLDAIKTALLVLVLSRPDLKLYDPSLYSQEIQKAILDGKILLPHMVKANCGLEGMAQLADMVMKDYANSIQRKKVSPGIFRKMLSESIDRVAHDIYNTTGQNPQIEKIVTDQTKYLRTVTWGAIFKSAHPNIDSIKNTNGVTEGIPDYVKEATLWQSIQNTNDAGASTNSGLAMNPYGLDIDETRVDPWFTVKGVIQDRDPHMMEVVDGGVDTSMPGKQQVPASDVKAFMDALNPGMRKFYEAFIQPDGSIKVDDEFNSYLNTMTDQVQITGSADLSPVFYVNQYRLMQLKGGTTNYNPSNHGAVFYCRGLFAKTNDGQIFREAATALSLAGAAIRRSSKDSAWIALRAFDIFPEMDDFFETLANWMKSLQKSIKSIVDTIKRYIEFIEGRLVEIQALIRRINDLLQSILGFSFQIPQCSFLMTLSNGTMGVVGDLTNAKTKPADSPLAYGAGIAVVIPFGPAIAMDLIQALILAVSDSPSPTATLSTKPTVALVGIEGLPATTPPGDEPPDVL